VRAKLKTRFLIALTLLFMAICGPIAEGAENSSSPVKGYCSKEVHGIPTDTSLFGIYSGDKTNTCLPISITINSVSLSPSVIKLQGKSQTVTIHVEIKTSSPSLRLADTYVELRPEQNRSLCLDLPDGLFYSYLNLPANPDGRFSFDVKLPIIASCPSGIYGFSMMPDFNFTDHDDYDVQMRFELKTLPENLLRITNTIGTPVIGSNCSNLSQIALDINSKQIICAKISGKLKWSLVPGHPIDIAKEVTPTTSIMAGKSCTSAGKIEISGGASYVCAIVSKKKIWVQAGNTPIKTGITPNSNTATSNSEADNLARDGCRNFPMAIVRLQNSSGQSFNPAFLAAQEAGFNISQAGRLDSKYLLLSNAQRIIIEYAQAVGWGGRGYLGDINVVKSALATFNSMCNTSLSLK